MNGWLRLWVLLTAIWGVIVVGGALAALHELEYPPLVVESEEGILDWNREVLHNAQLSDSAWRAKKLKEREEIFAASALAFIVPPIVFLH